MYKNNYMTVAQLHDKKIKVDEMSIIKYHCVMNIGYEISITNYRNDIMSGSELSI